MMRRRRMPFRTCCRCGTRMRRTGQVNGGITWYACPDPHHDTRR